MNHLSFPSCYAKIIRKGKFTRKSSCVKTQEAYRPRHILSVACPGGGGGSRWGGTLSWFWLGAEQGIPCPGVAWVGGAGYPCPGPGWQQGGGGKGVPCPGPGQGGKWCGSRVRIPCPGPSWGVGWRRGYLVLVGVPPPSPW